MDLSTNGETRTTSRIPDSRARPWRAEIALGRTVLARFVRDEATLDELAAVAPLLSDSIDANDLNTVVNTISDSVLEAHPRLAFARARSLIMAGALATASKWCAIVLGSTGTDIPLRARALWELGCISLADNHIAAAEMTLQLGMGLAEPDGTPAPDVIHLAALLAERRSARSAALTDYRKSIALAHRALTPLTRVLALRNLASALTHDDPRSAQGLCAFAAALIDGDSLDPRVAPSVENVFAYALICGGDLQAGRERAAAAASHARLLGHALVESYARFNECVALELLGDTALARQSLNELSKATAALQFEELSAWIRLRLAWLALKSDEPAAAGDDLKRTLASPDAEVLDASIATVRSILDFRVGRVAEATVAMQTIIAGYAHDEDWLTTFALLLWLACFHDRLGERTAASAAVAAALQIGRARGFRLSPNWWSEDLPRIATALAAPGDREYAALLISTSGSVGPSAAPLVVVSNVGAVRIEGDSLPEQVWRVGRTGSGMLRRIFRCLIAAHPIGLTRDEMADLLWPDTEGDRAVRNLYAALNDLRRVLREVPGLTVVFEHGRYRLLAGPSTRFEIEPATAV